MFLSLRKAEEAALNGEGPELDTQQCLKLQLAILSSSPLCSATTAADNKTASNSNLRPALEEEEKDTIAAPQQSTRREGSPKTDAATLSGDKDTVDHQPTPDQEVDRSDNDSTARKKLRRDRKGRLRLFDPEGREHPIADQKRFRDMEESTQKSSLTPTQANSESAYDHLELHRPLRSRLVSAQGCVADVKGKEDCTENVPESLNSKQHLSAVTDSTAYTYKENDTGHVTLDFPSAPENHEMYENLSQDASFGLRPQEHSSELSCGPTTPGPPVNPFLQKGSVMKGHEMFGATQPSSIGRHIASPTSSRPSPDIYNNLCLQKGTMTSPLERCGEETSILQSSVRLMLRTSPTESSPQAESQQITTSRSLDSRRATRREPRDTYVSTKESQERRQNVSSASLRGSETDSESDIDAIPRRRQWVRHRDMKIQRQLDQVTSSRPASGTSGNVEVPASGGRRRSVEESYAAQCNGTDARDTQPDDVIIDSQAIAEHPEAIDLHDDSTTSHRGVLQVEPAMSQVSYEVPSPRSSPQLPARRYSTKPQRVPDLYPDSRTDQVTSPPEDAGSPLVQPSFPLQELSTNRNVPKTPGEKRAQILSDGADPRIPNTILETSPLGDGRIRPLAEVTSLSFADNAYDDAVVGDAPGFTQDVEFNDAVNPRCSPTPPARPRVNERGIPPSKDLDLNAKIPAISSESPAPEVSSSKISDDLTIFAARKEARKDDAQGDEKDLDEPRKRTGVGEIQGEGGKEDKIGSKRIEENGPVSAIEGQDGKEVEAMASLNVTAIKGPKKRVERIKYAPYAQVEPRLGKSSRLTMKPPKEPAAKRVGLRSKEELRGPSKALRRSEETTTPTALSPQLPPRLANPISTAINAACSSKHASDASSVSSTPLSSLASTPAPSTRSSTRKRSAASTRADDTTPAPAPKTRQRVTEVLATKEETPVPPPAKRGSRHSTLDGEGTDEKALAPVPPARSTKRKPAVKDDENPIATRASKRQSNASCTRESSADPLAYPSPTLNGIARIKKPNKLFSRMAFAVSYVKQDKEKSYVTDMITEQGGRVLDDGFERLFEATFIPRSRLSAGDEETELTLTAAAKSFGFVALVADEHSRKAKYMQALALGLPCISGKWILTCVAKGEIVDWSPYLLCAGKSSFLGNAIRSRILARYSAIEAKFPDTLSSRDKLLSGKSILMVTNRSIEDARKAYVFLARAMGPARIGQVSDPEQARKKLMEDNSWDFLYVDKNEDVAEAALFGQSVPPSLGSKKRKRGLVSADEDVGPAPKRIRMISDEVIIQSLILGQLLEA